MDKHHANIWKWYSYQSIFKWSVIYPSIHALRLGLHFKTKLNADWEELVLRATLSNDISSATIQNGLNLRLPKPTRTEWFINIHFTFESANQNQPKNIYSFFLSLSRPILRHEGCENTGISQYDSQSVQRQVTPGTHMSKLPESLRTARAEGLV